MNSGVGSWRVLSFWGLPRIMVVILSLHLPSFLLAQVFPPEVKKASEAFVCQCNCNHQLSACGMVNCGSATPLRQEIAGHLKEGKTQQQIVDAFVAKYGKVILSAPTTQGLDLAAWMIPFVVLLLGLILVYVLIKAWVQRRPVLAQAGGKAVSIPESYRESMERELKDFEP